MRRVFGSLTPQTYEAIKTTADAQGRTVWQQIWAESCAYRSGTPIAPKEILARQAELLRELRQIGNNINQLAKLGHIEAKRQGGLVASMEDHLGAEVARQLERLEAAVALFADHPPMATLIGGGDDH